MAAFLTLPDGKQVEIDDGMVIGRDKRAAVVLEDTKASRRHARLISQGGVVELEDMESSNGTLLNGKPIQKRMLRDGDEIRIGTTTLRFHERVDATVADSGDFAGGEDLFGGAPDEPVAAPAKVEEVPFEPVVEVRQPKDAEPVPEPEPQDEILEFADDDIVVVKRTAADLAPKKTKKAAARATASAGEREGGVLQFNRVEDKKGLAVQDLGQMSGPMRALLTLVALAIAAGLFYLAMKLAS